MPKRHVPQITLMEQNVERLKSSKERVCVKMGQQKPTYILHYFSFVLLQYGITEMLRITFDMCTRTSVMIRENKSFSAVKLKVKNRTTFACLSLI